MGANSVAVLHIVDSLAFGGAPNTVLEAMASGHVILARMYVMGLRHKKLLLLARLASLTVPAS